MAATGAENVQLQAFTDVDRAPSIAPYVAALEAFDALPQLQELKALARDHAGLKAGSAVLDVGCGFGLESLRLARLVRPGGRVAGIDKSADFIREAEARAAQAKLTATFEVADAEALPSRTPHSTSPGPSVCSSIYQTRNARSKRCGG